MHKTLRGVFAEPKPPPRRNFLRENVLRIKHIQKSSGDLAKIGGDAGSGDTNKRPSFVTTVNSNKSYNQKKGFQNVVRSPKPKRRVGEEPPGNDGLRASSSVCKSFESLRLGSSESTLRDQGIQTEGDVNDELFLKDTLIRYPSNLSVNEENSSCPHHHQHQPATEVPSNSSLRKESSNISSAKSVSIKTPDQEVEDYELYKKPTIERPKRTPREPETPEPVRRFVKGQCKTPPPDQKLDIPANYKMGEVPKYLKERKDELAKLRHPEPEDACCPEGHILLPDEDRLKTLDIAKKRFEILIKELNKLPMTSETLRVRQRKMDIEKELIKLEDNIRIFSRGKVYVKLAE